MSYNGYANAATFHMGLLVDNTREVYFPARAIVREHGSPGRAAPYLRTFVTSAMAGRSGVLGPADRAAWREQFRHHELSLEDVDWAELARTLTQDEPPASERSGSAISGGPWRRRTRPRGTGVRLFSTRRR